MRKRPALLRALALGIVLVQAPVLGLSMVCATPRDRTMERRAVLESISHADECVMICPRMRADPEDELCVMYGSDRPLLLLAVFGMTLAGEHVPRLMLIGPCNSEPRDFYLNPILSPTTPPPRMSRTSTDRIDARERGLPLA